MPGGVGEISLRGKLARVSAQEGVEKTASVEKKGGKTSLKIEGGSSKKTVPEPSTGEPWKKKSGEPLPHLRPWNISHNPGKEKKVLKTGHREKKKA